MSDAIMQALGRTISGANEQGDEFSDDPWLIDLTLDDGSSLIFRSKAGIATELKRPTPRPLSLRERLSGKVQL